ncbi:hypothetical protein BASA61_003700 [Batrachochytrium salamandrivorans]|nr:hypothetical protein BASA61_003700 [Batrachochytrium salamandrivorans]
MGLESTTSKSSSKQPRNKTNQTPAASSRAASALQATVFATSSVHGTDAIGTPPIRLAFGQAHLASMSGSSIYSSDSDQSQTFQPYANTQTLHTDLKVIIKKLAKRDSITRIRALDECTLFVSQHPPADLLDFLPSWPSIYGKFAIDSDRRVREATARLHAALVKLLQKQLAPVLKDIIGPWLISQTDSSREVVSLSKESFQNTFPNKLENVLQHCQTSLLAYVQSNILEQTPESMSDLRFSTPEDMVSKYSRAVSGSFDIISTLISTLSADKREAASKNYIDLFDNPKVWEFSSYNEPKIRHSCYMFIAACIDSSPDILEERLGMISTSFLGKAFSEKSPWNHAQLWDTIIKLLGKFPNAWDLASSKKKLADKLAIFLNNGAYGGAESTYPWLVSLLGCIHESILSDNNYAFYTNFFDAFWKGLEKINQPFAVVLVSNYLDCIAFVLSKFTLSEKEAPSFLTKDATLRPILHLLFPARFPVVRYKFKADDMEPIIVAFFVKIWSGTSVSDREKALLKANLITLLKSGIDVERVPVESVSDETAVTVPPSTISSPPLESDQDVFCNRLSSFLAACNTQSQATDNVDIVGFNLFISSVASTVFDHTLAILSRAPSSASHVALLSRLVAEFPMLLISSQNTATMGPMFEYLSAPAMEIISSTPNSPCSIALLNTVTDIFAYCRASKEVDLKKHVQILWNNLMTTIFSVSDIKDRFKLLHVVCTKFGETGFPESIDTGFDPLDELVIDTVSCGNPSQSPDSAKCIGLLLRVAPNSGILSSSAVHKVLASIKSTLLSCTSEYLLVADKHSHSVSVDFAHRLLFSLQILSVALLPLSLLDFKESHHLFELVPFVFMAVLDLGIFFPASIATISWESSQLDAKMDESEMIHGIRDCAKSLWEAMATIIERTDDEATHSALDMWMDQWLVSFSDLRHCGSPSDFVLEIKTLLGLMSGPKMQSARLQIIRCALQSQDVWVDMSSPFAVMDDRLAIKDPFYHAISVVDPITDDHSSRDSTSMSDTPISYDHDGLCRYARMVLFVIGLLKDNVVEITSEYTWIWVELLRFAIISDHLFFLRNVRTDPMLWNADCGIASRHLADEVRVLIAEEMEISPYSLSEYAEAVTFGLKSSMSALDTPMIFVKALECALCEDTQRMSDATRFSYVASFQEISHSIFTKYLESEDDTTMWMDVYSNLVKKQEGHRPCTIAMRVSLGPLLRQVKSVTDAVKTAVDAICKYDRKMIQNVDDEFKVYKHALYLNALVVPTTTNSPLQKSSLITAKFSERLLRCIRTWFNSAIPSAKEILKARAEQAKSQSSCSSSSIATDLNLAVVDPIGSHRLQTLFYATVTQLQLVLIHAAPPGIAMTKFLVDLVHYRLEGLARQSVSSTSLSPSECVLLYHTLLLWQGISAIASTDQLEWVEMADIDWSISRTCLRLLVAISSGYSHTGEDMDGDLRDPMVQIQHLLCECVANLEYGKEDTISATTPDMIRPMMFAHDTVVQLTAWRMMHQYTAHTVCTRSLLVEMALLRPPSQDPSEELSSTDIATASNESSGSAHGNAEIHSDQLPATLIAGTF